MQNQEILDLFEIFLKEEDEFLIPVVKILEMIKEEKRQFDSDLSEVLDLLRGDERFKVYDVSDNENTWPDEEDIAMRELGFYKGPRVMLTSRTPSKEEFLQTMKEKMDKSLIALKKAYEVRPEEMSDKEEEEFLKIMKKTKELKEKIDENFNEQGEPE
jgi:hypothetical protein